MRESYVVRKERCPLCEREGKDTKGDNLVVYSDGHQFCYGEHGLVLGVSGISILKDKDPPPEKEICLPSDCDTNYPIRALQWVNSYELNRNDLLSNSVFWSDYKQSLIFPMFHDGALSLFSTRYFGTDKNEPKSRTIGRKNVLHVLGKGNKVVFCEDVVSAIKLGKFAYSIPLFGSFIGLERFRQVKKRFVENIEVVVWLDYDKAKNGLKEAQRGRMCGLTVKTIITENDPKDHNYEEIGRILN